MNGRGIIYFANGDRYEGEIVDGKRSGRGEDKRSNGEYYDGEFRNNRAHGYGTALIEGQLYTGIWSNGCFDQDRRLALWGTDVTNAECGIR